MDCKDSGFARANAVSSDILEDFRKALSEAEKRGAVQYKAERNRTELDMAVLHYKQEKEKQEKRARLFVL